MFNFIHPKSVFPNRAVAQLVVKRVAPTRISDFQTLTIEPKKQVLTPISSIAPKN